MPKQTKLNENAAIYQQRTEQTGKEKLKDMTFKKKVEYFWDYYKLHALVTIIAIAFLAYIIVEIITPKIEPQLYVAIVNNTIEQSVIEEHQNNITELLQLDREKEKVVISSQYQLAGNTEYSMNMRHVLTTYIAAQEVDIIIAPKSEFETFSYYGYMYPLSDLLPTNLYSSLSEEFYIGTQEDNPKECVYGIYLDNSKFFNNNALYEIDDPYILGVIGNTLHQENSIEYIRYLFR